MTKSSSILHIRRHHLFFTLVFFAIIVYAIQFFIFKQAEDLNTYSPEHARLKSRAYKTVLKFLNLSDTNQVTVILIDPFILEELVEESFKEAQRPCRFLCKNHVYTFAVVDEQFDTFNKFVLRQLADQGFSLTVTYLDPVHQTTPTHILLRDHENHAIHIVIFYRRGSSTSQYFWYGANPGVNLGIDFSSHAGLLDVFEYPRPAPIDGVAVALPLYPKKFIEEYRNSRYIPCNGTSNEKYHAKHPRDLSGRANEFREKATTALLVAKQILDGLEIPFWLSSGTLLGWYRQCDFIVYSGDVDIGIFIKHHRPDFLHIMKQAGMHLEHKFGRVSDSLQYAYDMGDIKLDMFFFYEEKDHMWNGGTEYSDGTKYKYRFPKFTLCWTEFFNMKLRVPCETETYIQANYGPNWIEPNKTWDWKTSPFNVEEVEPWKTEELSEVIQLWDKKGKRIPLEWEEGNDEL